MHLLNMARNAAGLAIWPRFVSLHIGNLNDALPMPVDYGRLWARVGTERGILGAAVIENWGNIIP